MDSGVWSIRVCSVSRGITVFIVQMFYCRRISVLAPTYYKYLAVGMVPLILSELGFSIAAAVEAFIVGTFTGWERKAWIDGAALAIVMVADIIVAATMVIILYKSRTGIKR
ncbi:hypothetical protein GSI_15093 [Ganoderma sinense ZZ0214-1]|uniref:Uncharacterized protein n=1 Tax=Ganoderma sinense ZZ0214-1 TaxID=1077348 RepID=A0A2G8RLK8_9APHY|nr:hypothetical protein GSI_15093 [Ganoderma sinense ZZ0214-1]